MKQQQTTIAGWKSQIGKHDFWIYNIVHPREMWMRWAQCGISIGMCPGSSMLVNGFYWANFELDLCGRRALSRPTLCANRAHLTLMKISPCPGWKALEISFHGGIKRDARDKFESWPPINISSMKWTFFYQSSTNLIHQKRRKRWITEAFHP